MTLSTVGQAEKLIRRRIREFGTIGDKDRPFMDALLRGVAAGCNETRLLFAALDGLEAHRKVFVRRDPVSGQVISVEEYDCSKDAPIEPRMPPPPKPPITNYALLIEIHRILRNMATSGMILNGMSDDEFRTMLYQKVSERFAVAMSEVTAVFGLMSRLGLRSNARSLRGSGMAVAEVTLSLGNVTVPDQDDLASENQRLRQELERILEENQRLTDEVATLSGLPEEIERLGQSNAALHERNMQLDGLMRGIHGLLSEQCVDTDGKVPALRLA